MKAKNPLLLRAELVASRVLLALGLAYASTYSAHASLTHRYSFTADATDSVGGANGTLMNGASIISGAANFNGGTSGPNCDYVQLPPGLISNYTSVTFEMWVDVGANGTWEELYALGNQNAAGQGANMVMFCPHSGSNPADFRMSYAQADPGFNGEYVVNGVGVLDGLGPMSVTCVYDPPNNSMSLYTNGVLVASVSPVVSNFSLTNVYNVNSWLGRSMYNGDSSYAGTMDEFRIYNSALGPLEIAVDNAAGPDTVVTNIVVNSIVWNTTNSMFIGSRQDSTVTFNTASYGTFTVAGSTEAKYTTSDPTIATVDVHGRIFALNVGTATLSASYNNQTNSVVLTIGPPVLAHRYSFTTDASDSVGGANGTLMNGATISGGAVVLATGTNNSADPGVQYVDLPNNLLQNFSAITIESWVTDNGSRNWARIFDLGNSGAEDVSNGGSKYVFLSLPSGNADLLGSIHVSDRAGGDQPVEWVGGRPGIGQKADVVWASDAARHTAWLYVNGALVGINTNVTLAPIDIGPAFNDWLGRSQYNDPMFNGSIDEFRIWNGSLGNLRVAINAAAGPNQIGPVDPGTLQAVHLLVSSNLLKGGQSPATVYADFSSISNVNASTLAGTVFTSSDTNVIVIDPNGLMHGIKTGTATISASYNGKTDSATVTVFVTPVILTHRWNFNETTGTTVHDLIGTANGTLSAGGATLDGTSVTLDGLSGYVSLPGSLINGFNALTVEAWLNVNVNTANDANAQLFAIGSTDGANELDVRAFNGGNSTIDFYGPPTLTATRQKGLNSLGYIHLVALYNPPFGTIDLFVNGVWQNSQTNLNFSLSSITNTLTTLGANLGTSNFTAVAFDEFRIYNGALDLYGIRTSFAAGPNNPVADGGTPTSVALAIDPQMVLGSKQIPHVHASFASVTNVDLTQTAELAFSSSAPGIVSVAGDGRLQAVGGGTANITVTLKGQTATKSVTVFPKQTMLVHRYSFTNDVSDSVGAQDGVLFGNAVISGGQVNFDGDGNSYVELPNHMLNTYDSVTIESWATFGASGIWARLYDFGHYNPTGDGSGRPYAFLCPHTGSASSSLVMSDGTEAGLTFSSSPLDGLANLQVVAIYDPPNNKESVYTNGVLAASGTLSGKILANVDDLKCWLGRSMWSGDNGLTGSIDEFRIYAGALTPAQITADLAAGPDKVVLPPPVNAPPRLTFSLSAGNFTVSWPTSATGLTLKSTPTLGSTANWTTVSTQPIIVNGNYQVTVPVSGKAAYYGLFQ